MQGGGNKKPLNRRVSGPLFGWSDILALLRSKIFGFWKKVGPGAAPKLDKRDQAKYLGFKLNPSKFFKGIIEGLINQKIIEVKQSTSRPQTKGSPPKSSEIQDNLEGEKNKEPMTSKFLQEATWPKVCRLCPLTGLSSLFSSIFGAKIALAASNLEPYKRRDERGWLREFWGRLKGYLPWSAPIIVLIIGLSLWFGLSDKQVKPPVESMVTAAQPMETNIEEESDYSVASIKSGPMTLDRDWRDSVLVDTFVMEKGGTLSQAFEKINLSQAQRRSLYLILEREQLLSQVKPGERFSAWWNNERREEQDLERLEYVPEPGLRAIVFMPGGPDGFYFFRLNSPARKIYQAIEGQVEDTFWTAAEKAGLEPWVSLKIIDLMASQIDFVSDVRKGDDFQFLFLGEYREGKLIATPIIKMIRMTNGSVTYEFFRHVGADGQEDYFDDQFRSIHKAFFKSPLQYKRVSSKYTNARMHPILKIVRPHLGVDYAAPQGTPVSAVADGAVKSAGFRGGYGRLVVLDHEGDYQTMYAHLSVIAKGLKPGTKVSQGDYIGDVGATGLATGPHLDFRILRKGAFINPEEALSKIEGRPLPLEERMTFAENMTKDMDLLKKLLAK
ncbi:MAG: M23 family metallopeptidase [Deltaproteobacteria bacterium]|jgi:murein DD-endopeptidase MepM/ murein hydrolase activator NlpD|nr:M23 family metallopeptidase [Deltaproteobacteria bacterium]